MWVNNSGIEIGNVSNGFHGHKFEVAIILYRTIDHIFSTFSSPQTTNFLPLKPFDFHRWKEDHGSHLSRTYLDFINQIFD